MRILEFSAYLNPKCVIWYEMEGKFFQLRTLNMVLSVRLGLSEMHPETLV